MSSWNRRVEAAARVRDASDLDGINDRLDALGIPTGVHPDDAVTLSALLRLAEHRTEPFSTTMVARIAGSEPTDERQLRVTVVGDDNGASALIDDLDHQRDIDPVTGLGGRASACDVLDRALRETANEQCVAVYNIDVDRFKFVNDQHGFDAGDDALRQIATYLEAELRTDDVISRFGGNGFVVVCPNIPDVDQAMALAERFRAAPSRAPAASWLHDLTLSVGVAVTTPTSPARDRSAERLLSHATTALHHAKAQGRDRCERFTHTIRATTERRLTLNERLRTALDNDSFRVDYEPVVDLAGHRVVGCEVSVRLGDDEPSHLDVRELLAATDDLALVSQVEEAVVQRAAGEIHDLHQAEDTLLQLALNISEERLADSRFPLTLARSLHAAGLPAEHIHLELPAAVLTQHGPSIRLVTQLRALGVHIAIDDVHDTAPLGLLDPTLVDVVKLDRRLVQGIHGAHGYRRVQMITETLREQGVAVCALGVETESDLAAVIAAGCTYAQGGLIAPPTDIAGLAAIVAS
ncbi:MAG: GGDEF and EAL domain-containing protein [Actinomycetota bacterium]